MLAEELLNNVAAKKGRDIPRMFILACYGSGMTSNKRAISMQEKRQAWSPQESFQNHPDENSISHCYAPKKAMIIL